MKSSTAISSNFSLASGIKTSERRKPKTETHNFVWKHVDVGDADRPVYGFKSDVSEENCFGNSADRL